jgi:hypothetical protein
MIILISLFKRLALAAAVAPAATPPMISNLLIDTLDYNCKTKKLRPF